MSHNVAHGPALSARRSTRRVVIIATAAATNGLAWVGGSRAHVDYLVQTPLGARQIGIVLVIVATAISGLAGWAAFSLLERRASNPVRRWIALAVVVLALSTVPIFVLRADPDARQAQ